MINEVIITTLKQDGAVHIAPMGISYDGELLCVKPFQPSTTLANLQSHKQAVINFVDDVRVFAGCLTDRYDWDTVATTHIKGQRLVLALSHIEVKVVDQKPDPVRPVFYCQVVHQENHVPFMGLNRAKAAVIEAAVLVSRLSMLSSEKVDSEIAYLQIAIDKTAGAHELEAWGWLMQRIQQFRENA